MHCFDGKHKVLRLTIDSADSVESNELYLGGYYNRKFEKIKVQEADGRVYDFEIEKPENYDRMMVIAEALSADYPLARVNLYNQNGQIWFGEITFYDNSRYIKFTPESFDRKMGDMFRLPGRNV